jgi:prepilin peptidase CpaA
MADFSAIANKATVVAVVLLISLAMYSDFRWRKIVNRLTLPAIVLGLLLNLLGNGWYGLLWSLLGCLAGIGLFLLPYRFGKIGGGDVKLMGALGALLGSYSVLNIVLYTAIVGGLISIVVALLNSSFKMTIQKVALLLKSIVRIRPRSAGPVPEEGSLVIPYGFAIGGGTICLLILGGIV